MAAEPAPESSVEPLYLQAAIVYALQHNPELAAQRQQHGIDASAVVIARTYPYNPTFELRLLDAHGGDVTNHTPYELAVLFELELRRQGLYRRRAADAALSRTDWDIAARELALAIRTMRAYQTVLYRSEKTKLIEKTVALDESGYEQAKRLFDGKKLGAADLVLARTEVSDARSQTAIAQSNFVAAITELRRALGVIGEQVSIQGSFERSVLPAGFIEQLLERSHCGVPAENAHAAALVQVALERRPEIQSRESAVQEAQARMQLARADRFGNPSVGPAYQFNETRANFVGIQASVPLAVFNTRRGEIQQRQAEWSQALAELQQAQIVVQQDVESAQARYERAVAGVHLFEKDVLPDLASARESLDKLFEQGDPSVDVVRMLDIRRKLLHAQDAYLDALWEVCQAQADLAAAVGWVDLACSAP